MDLTDLKLSLSLLGSLGRTLPRTGGRAPFGVRVSHDVTSAQGFVIEFTLAAAGDAVAIDCATGIATPTLPNGMTIAGTTSPSAAGLLLPSGTVATKASYSSDGYYPHPSTGTWIGLYWSASPARWNLVKYVNNVLVGHWVSASAVASPADATSWSALTGTGAPTVTSTARSILLPGGGGFDPEGDGFDALSDFNFLIVSATDAAGTARKVAFDHADIALPPLSFLAMGDPWDTFSTLPGNPLGITALFPVTNVLVAGFGTP